MVTLVVSVPFGVSSKPGIELLGEAGGREGLNPVQICWPLLAPPLQTGNVFTTMVVPVHEVGAMQAKAAPGRASVNVATAANAKAPNR
jgi:hypothetical protein